MGKRGGECEIAWVKSPKAGPASQIPSNTAE